jgi:hypothetical protein
VLDRINKCPGDIAKCLHSIGFSKMYVKSKMMETNIFSMAVECSLRFEEES